MSIRPGQAKGPSTSTSTGSGLVTGKVLIDGGDTVPAFLAPKIFAGAGIVTAVLTPGANEQLSIIAQPPAQSIIPAAGAITPSYATADTLDWAFNVNIIINAPSASNYLRVFLRLQNTDLVTNHTLSFNAVYRFASDIPAPTVVVAATTSVMTFQYSSVFSQWICTGLVEGF